MTEADLQKLAAISWGKLLHEGSEGQNASRDAIAKLLQIMRKHTPTTFLPHKYRLPNLFNKAPDFFFPGWSERKVLEHPVTQKVLQATVGKVPGMSLPISNLPNRLEQVSGLLSDAAKQYTAPLSRGVNKAVSLLPRKTQKITPLKVDDLKITDDVSKLDKTGSDACSLLLQKLAEKNDEWTAGDVALTGAAGSLAAPIYAGSEYATMKHLAKKQPVAQGLMNPNKWAHVIAKLIKAQKDVEVSDKTRATYIKQWNNAAKSTWRNGRDVMLTAEGVNPKLVKGGKYSLMILPAVLTALAIQSKHNDKLS